MSPASVLILTTTTDERDAVLAVAKERYGVSPELDSQPDPYVVFRLGTIGGTEVSLVQFQSGPYASGGIALGADDLIRQCRPNYVVLAGTCFGLRETEQELGDLVVVSETRDLDHKKRTVIDGVPAEEARGHRIPSSVRLSQVFSAVSYDWSVSRVHVGPMVSSGSLVNDPDVRSRLRAAHPDAVAGDMECHVLAAAATKQKADWIGVRGISDWGMRKDDAHRAGAAANAATYVFRVISAGLLATLPGAKSAAAGVAIQNITVGSGGTGYSAMLGNVIHHAAGSAAAESDSGQARQPG